MLSRQAKRGHRTTIGVHVVILIVFVNCCFGVSAEEKARYLDSHDTYYYSHSYDLGAAYSYKNGVFWHRNSFTKIEATNFYFSCLDAALYTLEKADDGFSLSVRSGAGERVLFSGQSIPYLTSMCDKNIKLDYLWCVNEGRFICIGSVGAASITIMALEIADPVEKKEITVPLSVTPSLCLNYIKGGKVLLRSNRPEFSVVNLSDGTVFLKKFNRPFNGIIPPAFTSNRRFWRSGQAIIERENRLYFRDSILDWEKGLLSQDDHLVHILMKGIDFAYTPYSPIGMQPESYIVANLPDGEQIRLNDFTVFNVIGYRGEFVFTPSNDMTLFDCKGKKFAKVVFTNLIFSANVLYANSPDFPFLFAYDSEGMFLGVIDIPLGVTWLGVQDSILYYRLGDELYAMKDEGEKVSALLPDDALTVFRNRIAILRNGSLLALSTAAPHVFAPLDGVEGRVVQISYDKNNILVEREGTYYIHMPDGEAWEIPVVPDNGMFSGQAFLSNAILSFRATPATVKIEPDSRPSLLVGDSLLYTSGNYCYVVDSEGKREVKIYLATNLIVKLGSIYALLKSPYDFR